MRGTKGATYLLESDNIIAMNQKLQMVDIGLFIKLLRLIDWKYLKYLRIF